MLNGLTIVASAFIYQHDNSTTKTNKFLWPGSLSICVLILTYVCSPQLDGSMSLCVCACECEPVCMILKIASVREWVR